MSLKKVDEVEIYRIVVEKVETHLNWFEQSQTYFTGKRNSKQTKIGSENSKHTKIKTDKSTLRQALHLPELSGDFGLWACLKKSAVDYIENKPEVD